MIKKLIPLILALAAMFCLVPMRGDTPPDEGREIPLKLVLNQPTLRNLKCLTLEAYFNDTWSIVQSITSPFLGTIEMTVTNLTTGETWSDTFDSAVSPHFLQISGAPGLYEITYLTSFGDLYEGTFKID